jgi:endonuclease-8
MEGPSLRLAEQHLKPFIGKRVLTVSGNSTLDQARLRRVVVRDIFAWGKHLVIQFDRFALRTHFLMFGTYEADVRGVTVTGDYARARLPRLALTFANGELRMFTCSVKFLEERKAKSTYDLSIDIMGRAWDKAKAMEQLNAHKAEQIADVLLDQTVFAGVGNIIKNEVLSLERINPMTVTGRLSPAQRRALIERTRKFSFQFLRWRKVFALRKNLRIHRQHNCPHCGGPVQRGKTGERQRGSYYCPKCQPLIRSKTDR